MTNLSPVDKGKLTRMAKADAKRLIVPVEFAKMAAVFHRDNGNTEAVRYYAAKFHDAIV